MWVWKHETGRCACARDIVVTHGFSTVVSNAFPSTIQYHRHISRDLLHMSSMASCSTHRGWRTR